MTKRQYISEIVNLEDMVPQDHFLIIIEEHFDLKFVYEEVEKLYSKVGKKVRPSSISKNSYKVSFS